MYQMTSKLILNGFKRIQQIHISIKIKTFNCTTYYPEGVVHSCLQYQIMNILFQGHPFSSAVAYFQNFCFIKILFISRLVIKVPNRYRILMTFSHRIQANTFTWPDMSFYAKWPVFLKVE